MSVREKDKVKKCCGADPFLIKTLSAIKEMYSKTEYLIERSEGNTFELIPFGRIPSGSVLNGRKVITVEGPGWEAAPKGAMPVSVLQSWLLQIQKRGYRFSVSSPFN